MIPLRDNIPSRTTPIVNYLIIGVCTYVFVVQLLDVPGQVSLIDRYGMIPLRVAHPTKQIVFVEEVPVETPFGWVVREVTRPAGDPTVPPVLTMLTCVFLHGGWLHFLGNMWFLFIFGDNVEDRLGHWRYLCFYLSCGIVASAAHFAVDPGSPVPTIGASGAIAGVMGAYFLLYPHALVISIVPIFFFFTVLVLPAPLFLGIWFVLQFWQGTLAITAMESEGVAWWAHIGGFVAGLLAVWILRNGNKLRPAVEEHRANEDHVGYYRVPLRQPFQRHR